MNKWSWKWFGIQFALLFAAALTLAVFTGIVIESRPGHDGSDATSASMMIGGFLAVPVIAALAGFKGWNLKGLLVAGFVVAGLFSANPVTALLAPIFGGSMYLLGARVARIISFRQSSENGKKTTDSS